MPEGDSLARVERRLGPLLTGQKLTRGELRVPALATIDLAGRTITGISAYGKHLFMEVDSADVLHSHLLMEGKWLAVPSGARWPAPLAQIRAVLSTQEADVLGIQLGLLEALSPAARDALVAKLGPDPIHAWDPELALELLLERPERQLGAALLDQRIVAGIGNIFRSESLFAARVSPFLTVGEVTREALSRVIAAAATQLKENAARESRRTAGPSFRDRYWVYGRAGRSCPREHGRVIKAPLADPDLLRGHVGGAPGAPSPVARDVYWCPVCQPGPLPAGPGAVWSPRLPMRGPRGRAR